MVAIYQPDYIFSLKDQYTNSKLDIDEFLTMYNDLINQDHIKPLFSQSNRYDLFPKKNKIRRYKSKDVWAPSVPKTNIEKLKKTIKIILNKITEKNYGVLIETLICEIGKFNTYEILEILAEEIIQKVTYDANFHNIYIKLCNRIWSMKMWHEELITIVVDENGKLYWHKNSIKEDDLKGPYETDIEIREYTNKHINFRYVLLDMLYQKFQQKDEFISKSKETNIDDDIRYKYRRELFSTIEFIGKLYKKNMIPEKIIHVILIDLICYTNFNKMCEEYVESFCILWKIIDEKIISPIKFNIAYQYLEYINKKICSLKWTMRIKFMLKDFIERFEKKYKKSLNDVNYFNKNMEKSDSSDNDEDCLEEIENIIVEFKKNYNCDEVLDKLIIYKDYTNNILDIIIYYSLDNIKNSKHYVKLISKSKSFNIDNVLNAFTRTLDNIDEISMDIPNAKKNLLEMLTSVCKIMNINLNDNRVINIFFGADSSTYD